MRKRHPVNHAAFLGILAICSHSVSGDEPGFSTIDASKTIDQFMSTCFANEVFHGAVLVFRDGMVVYNSAFGKVRPDSDKALNTDTSFYLASVSKQFTSMAVMILKDRHLLTYDDPLSKWFPQFPEFAKRITLRHLMTHTSGLPDAVKEGVAEVGMTNQDVVEFVAECDLLFQPGEQFAYSNSGYVLLALIVEKTSNEPFPAFLRANVFEPLHMNQTWIRGEAARPDSVVAAGYNMFGQTWDHVMLTTGSGGMYSSVNDLFKWDMALRNHTLVKEETLKEAFARGTLNSGKRVNSGFGWEMNDDEGVVFHTGSWCGYRSLIHRDTQNQETIILLTNRGELSRLFEISTALQNILKNKAFDTPPRIAALQLRRFIKENGADGIAEYYKRLKNERTGFVFEESHLRRLGVFLHREESDPKAALAVFALNVLEHPKNFRAHDYLGNAYFRSGDLERAEYTFKKSLTLNPTNPYALRKIKAVRTAMQRADK